MACSSSSNRFEVPGTTGRQEDIRTRDNDHRRDYMMYLIFFVHLEPAENEDADIRAMNMELS
jgi:hypothetical protein